MSEDCRHQESKSVDPWAESTADCPGPCWHGTAGTQLVVAAVSNEWRAVGQPSGKNQGCPSTLTPGHGFWVPLGAKDIIKSHIREVLGDKTSAVPDCRGVFSSL